MSKWLGSRVLRREQLSQQERLIEQRKREIELKLNQSSDKDIETNDDHNFDSQECDSNDLNLEPNIVTNDNELEDNKNDINIKIEIKAEQTETEETNNDNNDNNDNSSDTDVKPIVNKFKNDGSFFAQFLEMQKQLQNNSNVKNAESDHFSSDGLNSVNVKTEVKDTKQGIRMVLKTPQENKCKLKVVSSSEASTVTFSDEEEDTKVSPPEDKDIRMAIERTAISVTMNGVQAEDNMRKSKLNNNHYCWLNDKESSSYKYFEKRVEELAEAKRRAQNEGSLPTKSEECAESSTSGTQKKQRRSRWSDEKIETQNFIAKQDPALVQYAIQVFGNTNLTSDQWKQLEDQRKMKMLFEMLQKKQKAAEALARAGKVKYEYDSDEDISDGTWEHKRRKQEMSKTQLWADELTEKAHGKHHIGDFMPPEELERFMQKWEAVKEGEPVSPESDYKDSKLKSDNVGFKMLQKLGWVEGQGLGSQGTGIADPINKSVGAVNNAGLGQTRPDELKEGDDEYEAYRKRMMLAYRFRPNPLNNPRRAYY